MNELRPRMSQAEFVAFLEHEHEHIELKTGVARSPLEATLVAMSNTKGGVILLGVDDDRTVVGLRRSSTVDEAIHTAAFEASNVGRFDIHEVLVGDQTVVAITVHPRHNDVASTSDGRVLVRRAGLHRVLAPREVAALCMRRDPVRIESTDSGVDANLVDPSVAKRLALACRWHKPQEYQDRWREAGLLNHAGRLTVAGALVLTDPAIALRMPQFVVEVRVFASDTDTEYVSRDVLIGPVYRHIDAATDLVMRHVGTEVIDAGRTRHEVPRLPRRVVREAITNAVAHRSYEPNTTPIFVDLRPGVVTVTSPGALPDPVTVATLRASHAPRNPTLIGLLRRCGSAGESGQGIDVIEDEMRLALLEDPQFIAEADRFCVRLPLRGLVSTAERGWVAEFERVGALRSDERILLVTLARKGSLTIPQARDVLGVDTYEVRARLERLRDSGVLVQHGARARAYYTLGSLGPQRSAQQIVLEAAAQGPITNEKARGLTGVERIEIRNLLHRLVEEGRLVQHGSRRGTYYTSSTCLPVA